MTITKWNDLQLKFDLPMDEAEEDAIERAITPEAARQISEAAASGFGERIEQMRAAHQAPEWLADYLTLREQGWPWRVGCYIAWASSPKIGRWPETLQELATDILGLTSPRVIYTWRRKYNSIDTVVMMMQSKPLWDHRKEVLTALVAVAIQPDYKSFNDRKLFLEITGDYTPKSQMQIGELGCDVDLSQLSDADLERIAGELGDMLKQPKEEKDD